MQGKRISIRRSRTRISQECEENSGLINSIRPIGAVLGVTGVLGVMDIMRGFAGTVESTKEKTMERTKYFFKKLYFELTAYMPRRLPMGEEEFFELQDVLMTYYGITDREDVWLTLCGQVSSTPATKIRRSYRSLANACKRLDVNKTAREIKTLYITQLENKLRDAAEKMVRDEEATSIKPIEDNDGDSGPVLSIGSLDLQ